MNKPIQKETLIELYVNQTKSIPQVAAELSVGKTTVQSYLKKYDIPRRSIKEALSGKPKSESHRKKLSDSKKGERHPNFGKKCPVHGKRCWYVCPDGTVVSMRSQWEVWYAEYLREKKIAFKYEPKTFLLSDGSAYTPDFYLETSQWVEIKGWLTPDHKEKIEMFRREYPSENLILANRAYLEGLGIDLKRRWLSSKPAAICWHCGQKYHRANPAQRFCSKSCSSKRPCDKFVTDEPMPARRHKRTYKGRQDGSNNNSAKLTEEIVLDVRRLHENGYNTMQIREITGVSPGNISNIVRRKSWKHI